MDVNNQEFDVYKFIKKILEKKLALIISFFSIILLFNIIFIVYTFSQSRTNIVYKNIAAHPQNDRKFILSDENGRKVQATSKNGPLGLSVEIIHHNNREQEMTNLVQLVLVNAYMHLINTHTDTRVLNDAKSQADVTQQIFKLENFLEQLQSTPITLLKIDDDYKNSSMDMLLSESDSEIDKKVLIMLSLMGKQNSISFIKNYIQMLRIQKQSYDEQIKVIREFKSNWNNKVNNRKILKMSDLKKVEGLSLSLFYQDLENDFLKASGSFSFSSRKILTLKDIVFREILILIFSFIFSVMFIFVGNFIKDVKSRLMTDQG